MKINVQELERVRGRLIVILGRNVTWGEFARMCNLSINTISGMRHKRTSGCLDTIQKIVEAMRAKGLEVQTQDFLTRF